MTCKKYSYMTYKKCSYVSRMNSKIRCFEGVNEWGIGKIR